MTKLPDGRPISQNQLARLVDGGLDDQQYRRLLRQLEREPDGWRRCALAFLEQQALETDLGALCDAPIDPPVGAEPAAVVPPGRTEPGRARRRQDGWVPRLHLVAVVLAVVVVIVVIRGPAQPMVNPLGTDTGDATSHFEPVSQEMPYRRNDSQLLGPDDQIVTISDFAPRSRGFQ